MNLAHFVLGALLVGAIACDAPTSVRPTAPAYDPTTLTNGLLYRWPKGSTVTVGVVDDGHEGLSLINAVSSALNEWNFLAEFGEYRLELASSLAEAHIVIYDRAVENPMGAASCTFDPRGAGYTYFCPDPSNPAVAERIPFTSGAPSNVTVVISLDRERGGANYGSVVTHELGHALGIGGHSDNADDLMFGLPTRTSPSARDAETLWFVLSQRPGLLLR